MATKSKTKTKGVFTLKIGNFTAEVTDGASIQAQVRNYLQTLLPPGISLTSKQTGKVMQLSTKDLQPTARVALSVGEFIECNNVADYKPRIFSRVFSKLLEIAQQGSQSSRSRRAPEMLKLVQAGYLSKEKISTPKKTSWGATRNEISYVYKPLPKALALMVTAKNLPAKKINPDPEVWSAPWGEGRRITKTLNMLKECGIVSGQPLPSSKLASLYAVQRPSLYFTEKGEDAFLRQIIKITRGIAGPFWRRDWSTRTRQLQAPNEFQRALVKLVPKRELSILLASKEVGAGRYYKMILENTLSSSFDAVVEPL